MSRSPCRDAWTSAPCEKASTTADPSSPAAPVTKTRISLRLHGRRDGAAHRVDDFALLRLGQLAVDRQRQRLGRGRLGGRKLAAPIAEPREAFLQVKGHGIVDLAADVRGVEP